MNMFKRSRKAKEQNNDAWDALTRPQSPSSTFKYSKTTKRKNKHFVEEKPTIDLGTVLPDTNDFRTSLLMPGLSARFSMLREQDDPNSLIGKASDDSVLFPKRASRLNLFNHNNPLTDIAEVESIRSSFRPPFAERERSSSFGDGYDSDTASMMSRARPGEGNILFGGRQKLYRIPTGWTRNPEDPQVIPISGKHVYEDDVSLSLFQQYRTKPFEPRNSTDEARQSPSQEVEENDAPRSSSSVAFSKNRGTQSSTNSGSSNLRASTAATSVVSESPAGRSSSGAGTAASCRLTNDTPNTSVDSFGQSSSPGFRRLRDESVLPARQPSKSKSAVNIRDKFQRSGAIFTPADLRGMNPPLSAGPIQPLDFGFGDNTNTNNNNNNPPVSRYQNESPTPQHTDSVLASSVQPNDRGKATALGLFNKPVKEFDEQQYLQRQLQMHEGRNSPFSTNSRSASRASADAQQVPQQDKSLVMNSSPGPNERDSVPSLPPIPTTAASPVPTSNRASRASNASGGRRTPPSRPRSKSSASATAKDNVKARVESLIRRQNAELAALEADKLGTPQHEDETTSSAQLKETSSGAFFDNDASSDDEGHDAVSAHNSITNNVRLPNGEIHPAFRSDTVQSRQSDNSSMSRVQSHIDDDQNSITTSVAPSTDTNSSPLTAHLGLGLSGMIRTHLRQDSEKSSIMPPPSPGVPQIVESISDRPEPTSQETTTDIISDEPNSRHSSSNLTTSERIADRAPSPNTVMSRKAAQMLDQAMALRIAAAQSKAQRIIDEDVPEMSKRAVQDEREPSHRREESSETTKERREFDEELAERRRRIQEGLKSVVERERSTSPIAPVRGRDLTMQAFAQPQDTEQSDVREQVARTNSGDNHGWYPRPGLESRGSDEHRGRKMSMKNQHQGLSPELKFSQMRPALPHARYSPPEGYGDAAPASTPATSSRSRSARARSNSAAVERSKSRQRYEHEPSLPIPGAFPPSQPASPHMYHNGPSSPYGFPGFHQPTHGTMDRQGHRMVSSPLPDHSIAYASQPSPMSPRSPYLSMADKGRQASYGSGRTTPTTNGRATPLGSRKRSGTKTQISGPTFISSTSSVQLVPLPSPGSPEAPPLPEMNPRRRGSANGERSHPVLDLSNSSRTPLETVPASPRFPDMETWRAAAEPVAPATRSRLRLRKSSSEGGNMAAKARQQALLMDLAREKERSPAVPVFPNRSATALELRDEGGMF